MENYRFIKDLTSDIMFEAYGRDLKEVFENAAKALFDIICERQSIEKKEITEIRAEGNDAKDLMYNWLQALIASVDIDAMFYNDFNVKEITEKKVVANCLGEEISAEKGETVVKAVTYYNFEFEKTQEGYKTRVVVDI
ncbi:MAG: archease [Nanoarchaeota archaeon]